VYGKLTAFYASVEANPLAEEQSFVRVIIVDNIQDEKTGSISR
jgi:hypothetical protein